MMSAQIQRKVASRAVTLTEWLSRPESASAKSAGTSHAMEPEAPEADALLRAWRHAYSPGDADAFRRRLEWDGLDADRVASQLEAGLNHAATRSTDWAIQLPRFCAEAEVVHAEFLNGRLPESELYSVEAAPPFLAVIAPILRVAQRDLGVVGAGDRAVAPEVERALARQLVGECARLSDGMLLKHERIHSSSDPSDSRPTADPSARHQLIASLLDGRLETLFVEYPVLARHLVLVADAWVKTSQELLVRLASDGVEIAKCFNLGVDPGALSSIEPALSDPHDGRRRVSVLGFASGLRLAYKPRDVSLDVAYNGFLAWIGNQGLGSTAPPTLRVLPRDGYGWVEYAQFGEPGDDGARSGYFRQAGSLMCLTHLLRGRDLHMDNVRAMSTGPVLIDLEMLVQPEHPSAAIPSIAETGEALGLDGGVDRSCLETGLLTWLQTDDQGRTRDIGGLRGGEGDLPAPSATFGDGRNRVSFDGVPQTVGHHAEEVLSGFRDTYRLCLAERERILSSGGALAAFGGCTARVVFRNTSQYAVAQQLLAAPAYQRSGVTRSCALDALNRIFRGSSQRPPTWSLVAAEREALEALDVPRFTTDTEGTSVRVGPTVVLADYFGQSGLDLVRRGIQAMSEADLGVQEQLLRRALSSSLDSRLCPPVPPIATGEAAEGRSSFLSCAEWIGEEVVRARATVRGSPASLSGVSLYGGETGAALFLAALARVGGQDRWAQAAHDRLTSIRADWRALEVGLSADAMRLGGCDGLGSVVYALSWMGRLLADDGCIELAARVASHITTIRIDADQRLDVHGGAAGAILALLAHYDVTGDTDALERARACGRHLVDRMVPTDDGSAWPAVNGQRLAGLAHGAAGVSYALLCLGRETLDLEFVRAAEEGYRFERSVFSGAHRNWPTVGRAGQTLSEAPIMMNAWCHGAPGIALARVLALDMIADSDVVSEIVTGVATTGAASESVDHLCCGQLGRCETLLTVGRVLDRPELVDAARSLAERVTWRAIEERRFRLSAQGFEYRVYDPGFFRGLSGIGYQLLRLVDPDGLPTVLGFQQGVQCPRPSVVTNDVEGGARDGES